ncbi:UBP-type zinc finger domain-containing protein [Streptomyces sp. NPDC039016]|uniref:UBP-type zinc finger domain-containing protein n=1 Tax=unclassified Streptomyces TaxID=2593676 RepID=UPI00340ECC01
MSMSDCPHASQFTAAAPATSDGCLECLRSGDRWIHLRRCLTCGHVGCCDSSRNRHASRHYQSTRHPVVVSHHPGENWGWCFPDQLFLEFAEPPCPTEPGEAADPTAGPSR